MNQIFPKVAVLQVAPLIKNAWLLLAPKVEIQVFIDSGHIYKIEEQSFPVLLHFVEYPVSGSELIKIVNTTHPIVVVSNTAGLSDVQLDMLTIHFGVSCYHLEGVSFVDG